MVTAADIRDEDSLRAWLEGRPREDAVAIAARAALRVAPVLWTWADAYSSFHTAMFRHPGFLGERPPRLPIVTDIRYRRLLLTACVAAERNSARVRDALQNALQKAEVLDEPNNEGWLRGPVSDSLQLHYLGRSGDPSQTGIMLADFGGAPSAARLSAINAVGAILDPEVAPTLAAASVARLLQVTFGYGTPTTAQIEAAWALIATEIESGGSSHPFSHPLRLWHVKARPFGGDGKRDLGNGLGFWADWYEGYLTGKPLDIDLLEQVALIESEHWDKGDDHVNGIIARLRLEHAIERAPNGEIIAVNPETGRLRIEVDTALPADIGAYARRKVRAAVEVFALSHNQYTALAPDLFRLRQAADDPEYTPVELFDECAAASRRLASRIRNGEVPEAEQDALIADYGHRIREAGADILANDPKTQEVLTARARIAGTDALIAEAEAVRAAVDLLVPVTEGLLARRLPEDAVVATDPAADAEDRKVAGVKLASRVVRIVKVVAWVAAGAGGAAFGTVVGTAEVLEAIPVIQASPIFQALVQAVYRFLGF